MNPFEQLGIEARFGIERSQVERRARELGKTLHPDRFVGRPAAERRAALGRALEVNEAARALKDPILRARCLLELRGQLLPEAEHPQPDPMFLMDIMELRQALKQAGQEGNVTQIEELASRVTAQHNDSLRQLAEILDVPPPDEEPARHEQAQTAARLVSTLKYHQRFFDEAGALLDELD